MDVDPKDIARNVPEDPNAPADDWQDEFGEIEVYAMDGMAGNELLDLIGLDLTRIPGIVTHFKTFENDPEPPWLIVWHGDMPEPTEEEIRRKIAEIYDED